MRAPSKARRDCHCDDAGAVLQMPGAFEEQAHRGQLDDVKDVVVVEVLVGSEAAQLNAKPEVSGINDVRYRTRAGIARLFGQDIPRI